MKMHLTNLDAPITFNVVDVNMIARIIPVDGKNMSWLQRYNCFITRARTAQAKAVPGAKAANTRPRRDDRQREGVRLRARNFLPGILEYQA